MKPEPWDCKVYMIGLEPYLYIQFNALDDCWYSWNPDGWGVIDDEALMETLDKAIK